MDKVSSNELVAYKSHSQIVSDLWPYWNHNCKYG